MKKIISILLLIIIGFIVSVFVVGGKIGSYVWCASVFIIAPLALALTIGQIINLFIRIIRKKQILFNLIFIAISIIYTLPILVIFGVSPIKYPRNLDSKDGIEVQAPVNDGVYFGGKEYKTHAYWPSECYAYDIVKEPHDVGSSKLEDYGIYNEDVICPVNGTIIGMENNEEDIKPNTEEFTSSLGNYLFIKLDNEETYMILAHFKNESINVSVGDRVSVGDVLGKVGNSGTTSEPHLHIQYQKDNPKDVMFPVCAEGLPLSFKDGFNQK